MAAFEYDPKSASHAKIGAMYLRGHGVKKNPAEEVKWYRRAVQKGQYRYALWLAEQYLDGTFGRDLHLSHAFSWYLGSAVLGDSGGLEMARDLFPRLNMDTINRAMRLSQIIFNGFGHKIYAVKVPSYWAN
jgi:TPR repeat protein